MGTTPLIIQLIQLNVAAAALTRLYCMEMNSLATHSKIHYFIETTKNQVVKGRLY